MNTNKIYEAPEISLVTIELESAVLTGSSIGADELIYEDIEWN